MNLYSYAGSNPANYVDPTGHEMQPVRSLAASYGGTVAWNGDTGIATVTIGYFSVQYNIGDCGSGNGCTVIDDHIYVDDAAFRHAFGIGNRLPPPSYQPADMSASAAGCDSNHIAACKQAAQSYLPSMQQAVSTVAQSRGVTLTSDQTTAVAHVMASLTVLESGYNPTAVNHNSDGTTDYGLMQVNSGSKYVEGMSVAQIESVQTNILVATKIFFDKLSYVHYDVNRLWEAVGCYNGCHYNGVTGIYDPVNPAYPSVVHRIYQGLW